MPNDTPATEPLSIDDYVEMEMAPAEDTPDPTDEAPQEEQPEAPEVTDPEEEPKGQQDEEEADDPETEDPEEKETQILDDEYDDVTVKVGDEEMTLGELRKGHLRQSDYTRKAQEVADQRREIEAREAELAARETELQQKADNSLLEQGRPRDLTQDEIDEVYDKLEVKEAAKRIEKYRAEQKAWDDKNAERVQREEKQQQEFVAATAKVFLDRFPDYQGQEAHYQNTHADRVAIAKDFGFTDAEINSVMDMRLVGLLEQIRVTNQKSEATKKVVEKKVRKTTKVLKPGAKVNPDQDKVDAVRAVKKKYSGNLSAQQYAQMEEELAALTG